VATLTRGHDRRTSEFRTDGPRVRSFAQNFVIQTKGRWAGKPFGMEDWQAELLDELFIVDDNGNRVYREALIGEPRKNGKSSLCAVLALYGLLGANEAGAEVYAAAASRDQARIVFNQAREFVQASPRLLDWLVPQRNVITCPSNGGVFRVLASDAPLQHGLNPSMVVIDELHAHKDPELYYALTTGQLARKNPLVVTITTAGYDESTICWQVYEHGRKLFEEGLDAMRRERFLFRWWEAPKDMPYDDPETWRIANPASWIDMEDLGRECRRLPENVFRRLHLNQWTDTEEAWISSDMWDACRGTPIFDPDAPSVAAVDVGLKKDASAVIVVQMHGDKLHIAPFGVPGGSRILTPTENRPISLADVRAEVGDINGHLSDLLEVPYDPWSFRESAELLEERGVPMMNFDQTNARMCPASEKTFEMIKEGRMVHDGNRVLRNHIVSAAVQPTERGVRISKRKSTKKIDAAVALVMATDRMVFHNEGPEPLVAIV
jgi:phage terminase large subunit-like protein